MKKFTFIRGAVTLALASFMMTSFAQEGYPNRAITLIVPSAPGGTTDFTAL